MSLTADEDVAADAALAVSNTLLPDLDSLAGEQPVLATDGDCAASVSTFGHLLNVAAEPEGMLFLKSASVLKAKFKLEDAVNEAMCFPPRQRRQCRDINQANRSI